MHSAGYALRKGACANKHISICSSKGTVMYARKPTDCVWEMQFLIPKSKNVAFHAEVVQGTARSCAAACGAELGSGWGGCATTGRLGVFSWRMMLFWNSTFVTAHAMLPQNDEVTMVFQVYFSAGCCDLMNLSASLRSSASQIASYRRLNMHYFVCWFVFC